MIVQFVWEVECSDVYNLFLFIHMCILLSFSTSKCNWKVKLIISPTMNLKMLLETKSIYWKLKVFTGKKLLFRHVELQLPKKLGRGVELISSENKSVTTPDALRLCHHESKTWPGSRAVGLEKKQDIRFLLEMLPEPGGI